MVYMERSNKIVVTNIQDDEKVKHAVLVIEGKIIHTTCKGEQFEEFLVSNNGEKQTNHRLRQNQFKIILELKPNNNRITINYCCISHEFSVFYDRSDLECVVLPLYIINRNHDGNFQSPTGDGSPESACRRILTGIKLLQCIIAHKLKDEHSNWKSFNFKNCEIFHSNIDCDAARRMKQDDLWAEVGREIMKSNIGNSKTKYLGFLSCTRYNGSLKNDGGSYEDMINATEGHVALGGGGLALFGSACLYTWPQTVDEVLGKFEDDTMVDISKFMNDSCFRNTISGCFSTTLGSVLHELCHTLDLGHTKDGIMGRGFDNTHNFFLVDQCSEVLSSMRKWNAVKSKKLVEPYFTTSCSTLLNYHKFLNNIDDNVRKKYLLTFNSDSDIIRSTSGIRVVEVREQLTELVLHSWTFTGKILRYSFQLPTEYRGNILVVEDNHGNIIKETV